LFVHAGLLGSFPGLPNQLGFGSLTASADSGIFFICRIASHWLAFIVKHDMDSSAPTPAQDRPVHANIPLIETTIKKRKDEKYWLVGGGQSVLLGSPFSVVRFVETNRDKSFRIRKTQPRIRQSRRP
jgi:hypothetical protein